MLRAAFVVSVVAFSGCGGKASPEPPAPKNQAWAQEEILLQLKELREDVGKLQKDAEAARSLDARITALESAVARGAGNAAPAAAGSPEISLDDAVPRGSAKAKVAVVEFTDFECPYCARHFHETLPQIKKAFIDTGRIRYYARAFPLDFHAHAKSASIAAYCAGKAGKYWEMHDRLFSRQGDLGDALYHEDARAIGLDDGKFSACQADAQSAQRIAADVQYGTTVGVSGTPKFFIGRIQGNKVVDVVAVTGARPFDYFKSVIESKLK